MRRGEVMKEVEHAVGNTRTMSVGKLEGKIKTDLETFEYTG
jgi:hypothetical protein